jgi:hypothetical protein
MIKSKRVKREGLVASIGIEEKCLHRFDRKIRRKEATRKIWT